MGMSSNIADNLRHALHRVQALKEATPTRDDSGRHRRALARAEDDLAQALVPYLARKPRT